MQADHPRRREALRHAALELRRERDLGHQHQHLAAGRKHLLCDAQIDLGLATAGDALQQPGTKACGRRADLVDHCHLLGGQGRRRRHLRTIARARHRSEPAAAQGIAHRRAHWQLAQRAAPHRHARTSQLAQQGQRLAVPPGLGERSLTGRGKAQQRVVFVAAHFVGAAQPRGQREGHHLAERGVVIARDEIHKFEPVRRQRRHFALDVRHGLEPGRVHIGGGEQCDDQPALFAASERHPHTASDVRFVGIFCYVIKYLRNGNRKRDADVGHAGNGRQSKKAENSMP